MQVRTSCRAHVVLAEDVCAGADDELLSALCLRLSLEPDIRWAKVDAARDSLLATGPPSAWALADMLLDVLRRTAR